MKHIRGSRGKKLFIMAVCFCIICSQVSIWKGVDVSAAQQMNSARYDGWSDFGDWSDDTGSVENALDMTNVTLDKTKVEGYLVPTYSYGSNIYYGDVEFDIAVNSQVVLNENMRGINLTCKSSNKKVQASASLSDNILHLRVHGDKKCTTKLTVSIGGKKFEIKVSLKTVKISASSLLLEKGKTKKLKISGCSKGITWNSSNKKIATVSKDGVVKGKKIGNVVITAKIGNNRIGCAVSVTTKKLKKVCERATYIGTHWTYSQAKRTQNGYYDCSALVWKAYKECAGVTFGNAGYPGTTRTESAWCRDNNRMIKGGYTYKKVQKMQLNPGDLVFKSNNSKDPYNTTYHVEMFTGYTCLGYDSKGKPMITSLWASRDAGYGAAEGSLLARPMK
ncbi:MAG: Ig-like domain-containing protein [Roseburia sp.]|nr:Ig-like domain-containing protein [Roseburia sp.]